MRDPFANYDSWLEAPFQRMCAEQDAYVDWCERNGYDPDDEQAEADYQEYCDAEAEEAAERMAEARADAAYGDDFRDAY